MGSLLQVPLMLLGTVSDSAPGCSSWSFAVLVTSGSSCVQGGVGEKTSHMLVSDLLRESCEKMLLPVSPSVPIDPLLELS